VLRAEILGTGTGKTIGYYHCETAAAVSEPALQMCSLDEACGSEHCSAVPLFSNLTRYRCRVWAVTIRQKLRVVSDGQCCNRDASPHSCGATVQLALALGRREAARGGARRLWLWLWRGAGAASWTGSMMGFSTRQSICGIERLGSVVTYVIFAEGISCSNLMEGLSVVAGAHPGSMPSALECVIGSVHTTLPGLPVHILHFSHPVHADANFSDFITSSLL
jgi:hypothetical protein